MSETLYHVSANPHVRDNGSTQKIMLDLIYSYYLEHDKKKKETMHDDTVRALKGERS